MKYQTTTNPPNIDRSKGGRPRRHQALADAITAARPGEWVIIPADTKPTPKAVVEAMRQTYFPPGAITARRGDGGEFYIRRNEEIR